LAVSVGIVLSYEVILVLALVTIILSLFGSLQFLSASYTIGITFIVLLIVPFIPSNFTIPFIDFTSISLVHFVSLTILVAILLFIEAVLLRTMKSKQTYPSLHLSERGVWIGQFEAKRMMLIPFFVLIPTNKITVIAPLFPYFTFGEQSFTLLLLP